MYSDIQQGVAISLFLRRTDHNGTARVLHNELWGMRDIGEEGGKYGWLSANNVETASVNAVSISPRTPQHLFVPRDEALIEEYEAAWPLPRIFSPNGDPAPGMVTTHDQFAISWTRKEAALKVERLLFTTSENEARQIWRLCSQNQWQYDRAKRELADGTWREHIETVLYRPFDFRVTVFDRNVAVHRRERVMRHMLSGPNVGLSTTRGTEIAGGWEHVFVSNSLIQHHTVSLKEVNYLFPLYIYPTEGQEHVGLAREPNLAKDLIEAMGSSLGLEFISEGLGNLQESFGPDDVFNYIYAVLHSTQYRRRYADFLKSDFPRVPLTGDRALFAALVALGKRLTDLHLMESEGHDSPAFPMVGDNRVDKVRYAPPKNGTLGQVFINRDQHFKGVTPETWEFTIGGYRPAEKWLKDRKGRVLSDDDIEHYRKIVAALADTQCLMDKTDELIEQHGGWPDAFQ